MTIDTQTSALDLSTLVAPVPGDSATGESLRHEGTYDAIREARRQDDPTLPQGVWKTDLKKADWREVEALCVEALSEKTKDLQVAVWLAEAWLRRKGLDGLEAGFRLITKLSAAFWAELYPEIEDDDLEGRLAPLETFNDKISLGLTHIAVTEQGGEDDAGYTWFDWERALYDEHARSASEGQDGGKSADRPTRSEILAEVSATASGFYRDLRRSLAGSTQALEELRAELTDKCGDEAPSLGRFEETLSAMTHFVDRILEERQTVEVEAATTMTGAESSAGPDEHEPDGGPSEGDVEGLDLPIQSRAAAYRMLALAADYLIKTEPHSPTPYLVRRAIGWGHMPMAELLRELLRNKADLQTVYALLGIRQPDSYDE